jgi:hypothetical protein
MGYLKNSENCLPQCPLCGGTLTGTPLNDGFGAAIFLCFAGLSALVSLRFNGLNG